MCLQSPTGCKNIAISTALVLCYHRCMGFLDELMGDIKVIRGEYKATKNTITSSFAGLAGDVTGVKKDVLSTVDDVKSKTVQTSNQVKKSFDIKPTKKH